MSSNLYIFSLKIISFYPIYIHIKNELNSCLTNIKIFPNYANILYTFNSHGMSWTATEDCWLIGCVGGQGTTPNVKIDNVIVISPQADRAYVDAMQVGFVLVKQGQTITTSGTETSRFELKAYGLQS